jgi:predicted transcriptional regulator
MIDPQSDTEGCRMGRLKPADAGEAPASLPPQVVNLPRREREVAIILYSEGSMTAKDVHDRLQRDLSHSALRSMLMRLCRKDVLQRRKLSGSHHPSDRRVPYVYGPAITKNAVRQRALLQLARDYFDGSLSLVSQAVAEALHHQVPDAKARRFDVAA